MAKKLPSLAEALDTVERSRGEPLLAASPDSPPKPVLPKAAPTKAQSEELGVASQKRPASSDEGREGSNKQASRVGTKSVAGYFTPAVSKQLKYIALEQDSNIQELLREALNDLFRKYGKNEIA